MRMNKKYVNILIDYDNLGIENLEDTPTILDYIVEHFFLMKKNTNRNNNYSVLIRLYGGWYDENHLSRNAQIITTLIQERYPDTNDKFKCSLNVELSKSLASNPAKELLRTFRKRQGFGRVKICKIEDACCEDAKVSIRFLRKLKKKRICHYCKSDAKELVWVDEQKLVDVMLSMDIAHYSENEKDAELVIVSSDDDFIPAILQATSSGMHVVHIQTKKGRSLPEEYISIIPEGMYDEVSLNLGD